jgi:hypothetical protein
MTASFIVYCQSGFTVQGGPLAICLIVFTHAASAALPATAMHEYQSVTIALGGVNLNGKLSQ